MHIITFVFVNMTRPQRGSAELCGSKQRHCERIWITGAVSPRVVEKTVGSKEPPSAAAQVGNGMARERDPAVGFAQPSLLRACGLPAILREVHLGSGVWGYLGYVASGAWCQLQPVRHCRERVEKDRRGILPDPPGFWKTQRKLSEGETLGLWENESWNSHGRTAACACVEDCGSEEDLHASFYRPQTTQRERAGAGLCVPGCPAESLLMLFEIAFLLHYPSFSMREAEDGSCAVHLVCMSRWFPCLVS